MKEIGSVFNPIRIWYDNKIRIILCGLFLFIVSPSVAETRNRPVAKDSISVVDSSVIRSKPYFAFEARCVDMSSNVAMLVVRKLDTLQTEYPVRKETGVSEMCLYLSRFLTPQEEQCMPREIQGKIQEEAIIRKPFMTVKTNLLYDLALTPNIEVEIPIGKRWSVNAEYQLGWWSKKDNSFCWHLCSGGIEGRYWFGNRKRHNMLNGWFAGVFVNGGTYDFQLKRENGYQGDFITTGISGGYSTPIARNLNLEFSLGAGYVHSIYRHYDVIDRVLIDDGVLKRYNALLPVKAKVSLSWVINRRSKEGGAR